MTEIEDIILELWNTDIYEEDFHNNNKLLKCILEFGFLMGQVDMFKYIKKKDEQY